MAREWSRPEEGFSMRETINSEAVSRRRALCALATAVVAVPATVLTTLDAEAQTVGMQRRHERRSDRHDRRYDRRADRHERRHDRRTGVTSQ
jgi:hypothetical protein